MEPLHPVTAPTAGPVDQFPSELAVVCYGDLEGGGFSRHSPLELNLTRGDRFGHLVRSLETDGLGQLSADNPRHPIWSLCQVSSGGRPPLWCAVVQGRRGVFGAAGSAQYLFTPIENSPAGFWNAVTSNAADGLVDVRALRPAPVRGILPELTDQVRKVIAAVHEGRRRIQVDGDPSEVAQVIQEVLRTISPDIAARYRWQTCMMEKPYSTATHIVAGLPPEAISSRLRQTMREFLARP